MSLVTALATSIVTAIGSWFVFRGKRAEVDASMRKHIDENIDARINRYIDRLEQKVDRQKEELDALRSTSAAKIDDLEQKVSRLVRENRELRTFATAVRHDLRAIHRTIHTASKLLQAGDDAQPLMMDSLSRLDDLLDQTQSLVEESTPTVDDGLDVS